MDEEWVECRPKKRKRKTTPMKNKKEKSKEKDKDTIALLAMVEELVNKTSELLKLTKSNINTKVEIKVISRELERSAQKLQERSKFLSDSELSFHSTVEGRKASETENAKKAEVLHKVSRDADTQTSPLNGKGQRIRQPSLTNQGAITHAEGEESETTRESAEDEAPNGRRRATKDTCTCTCTCLASRLSTPEDLKASLEFGDFAEVAMLRWEETVYTNTKIITGNPLNSEDCVVKVVIVEPSDPGMKDSIQRMYKEKFPELPSLEGDFEVIEQITRIRGTGDTHRKKIVKMAYDETSRGLWGKLSELRQETINDERVSIHHVKGASVEELRRMTEVIFHTGKTNVEIHTTLQQKNSPKGRNTYGVIINRGGKFYKDILGEVKNAVGGSETANAIRDIRSTKDGSLLLTMDKDHHALGKL
ncbi:unnamed protein product [Phaedon cochleariae]|uniref:Uncharacterized protein n=1 Tax=Phaedon cochleariae TaxID=80249 RepID=A0A9N9X3H8_PHACE|nr:unnamed protein product [Phaedon cochleariae]